jgi:CheY-like chemotaxis protein
MTNPPDPDLDRLQGARVLVVDDDVEQATTLAELLRCEGVLAISESDPRVVLEDLISLPFDAIVLDVKMRGVSGPELLVAIRACQPDIPAIFLTGYELRDAGLEKVMSTGHVTYLSKPTQLPALLESLARALVR